MQRFVIFRYLKFLHNNVTCHFFNNHKFIKGVIMYLKKIGLTIISFLVCTSVLAANNLKSPIINLPGGIIKPNETFTLASEQLADNIVYTITCKISDPNNNKNRVILKVDRKWYINLNGNPVPGPQFQLTSVENTVKFSNAMKGFSGFDITNLDHDDPVTIESCSATPSVWGD
jgi:hypothetical protein